MSRAMGLSNMPGHHSLNQRGGYPQSSVALPSQIISKSASSSSLSAHRSPGLSRAERLALLSERKHSRSPLATASGSNLSLNNMYFQPVQPSPLSSARPLSAYDDENDYKSPSPHIWSHVPVPYDPTLSEAEVLELYPQHAARLGKGVHSRNGSSISLASLSPSLKQKKRNPWRQGDGEASRKLKKATRSNIRSGMARDENLERPSIPSANVAGSASGRDSMEENSAQLHGSSKHRRTRSSFGNFVRSVFLLPKKQN